MRLRDLPKIKKKSIKRLGRGYGSGVGGHTVGRGTKGQTSRVGKPVPLWFEGGQLALTKRMPYLRGKGRFKSLSKSPVAVSVALLNHLPDEIITPASLAAVGVLRKYTQQVKIVGTGTLERAVVVQGIACTESARNKIEKAGGRIE